LPLQAPGIHGTFFLRTRTYSQAVARVHPTQVGLIDGPRPFLSPARGTKCLETRRRRRGRPGQGRGRPGEQNMQRDPGVARARARERQGNCRFRSGSRAQLFRSSGDHLSGCGAILLSALGDRPGSLARVAPAPSLRDWTMGSPRSERSPRDHPRDLKVKPFARRDGRLEEAQPLRGGEEVWLVPARPTSLNVFRYAC
jgi:hypothetical protein